MQNHKFVAINILIIAVLLAACSNRPPKARVVDLFASPNDAVNTHVVAPGETLYSIAWRYDLDYKKLARVNNIDTSYKIYPGQKLSLNTLAYVAKTETKVTEAAPTPRARETPVTKSPAMPLRSKKETVVMKKYVKEPAKTQSKSWVWPAKGKINRTIGAKNGLHKGIDIQGKLGEPVRAASAGRVVYAGSGLRGYGKLLIIKHNEKYLSAYAHNRRILVEEGKPVKQGQKIAEMGKTGTDKVKLYFEIRFDGSPVDPLKYLP